MAIFTYFFWLNCGFRSLIFEGMQQLHKIQVKLEFEGHLQFYTFLSELWPFLLYIGFLWYTFPIFPKL